MEHRVKRRSAEWLKLQESVLLTTSHFADAVGIDEGGPFQFFQSVVEKDHKCIHQNADVCCVNGVPQIETSTESVIKEAYELLTGLRILESGFWVPEKDSPMHGLIGSSPDGLVVDAADTTRVLGLAAFRAPINDMYSSCSNSQGGIPRHYMVQMQGQMAVCGAPWCDFMALCSKTKEVMLKRVFFQPRYWEHVSRRLKQFCFALQEAEIMQELGYDTTSGLMAKRLKQQPTQDELLPAEDAITVQNLLRNAGKGFFRGPSRKLLSFDILVGDVYPLPLSLSRYSQELLAKVDAEIQHKTPNKVQNGEECEQENSVVEGVCRRVFYGDTFIVEEEREPQSPERVFGEGRGVFLNADDSVGSIGEELSEMMDDTIEGSFTSVSDAQEISVSGGIGKDSEQPQSSAGKPGQGGSSTGLQSSNSNNAAREKSSQGEDAQNISVDSRGRDNNGRTSGRGGRLCPLVSGASAARPVRGRGRGRGRVARLIPEIETQKQGQTAQAGSDPSGVGLQASRLKPQSKGRTGSPVPRKIPRISSSIRTGQAASGTTPTTQPQQAATAAISATATSTFSSQVGTQAGPTEDSDSASTGQIAVSKSSSQSENSSTSLLAKAGHSARDEWEMSAKRRPLQGRLSTSQNAVQSSVSQTPEGGTSQPQQIASTLAEFRKFSPAISASASDGPQVGVDIESACDMDTLETDTDSDQDHWRSEILTSGGEFVPPGLTLLSSTESGADQAIDMSMKKGPSTKETVNDAETVWESEPRLEPPFDPKPDSVSPQQTLKRSLSQQSDRAEVETKKPSCVRTASGASVEESDSPARSSGSGNEWLVSQDPESPTKGQIHRPWLQRHEARDQQPIRDQEHGAGGPYRDRPYERGQESQRRFDTHDQGPLARSWGDRPDVGPQTGARFPDRGGAQIRSLLDWEPERSTSLMRSQFDRDLERDREQGKAFDYDHRHRIMTEDFHRRTNPGFSQQSALRSGMLPEFRNRELESFRHNPADLRGPRDLDILRAGLVGSLVRDGGRALDRGINAGGDGLGMRSLQHQGHWLQQAGRSEFEGNRGLPLRPAHTNLPVNQSLGVGNFSGTPRAFGVPVRTVDRNFGGLDSRDPRADWERGSLRGPAPDFRGDLGRGQSFRNFPPGRRPFEF